MKSDFPIFSNRPLIYLDSAATTQKPQYVINKVTEYLSTSNANIHRGGYTISGACTRRQRIFHRLQCQCNSCHQWNSTDDRTKCKSTIRRSDHHTTRQPSCEYCAMDDSRWENRSNHCMARYSQYIFGKYHKTTSTDNDRAHKNHRTDARDECNRSNLSMERSLKYSQQWDLYHRWCESGTPPSSSRYR